MFPEEILCPFFPTLVTAQARLVLRRQFTGEHPDVIVTLMVAAPTPDATTGRAASRTIDRAWPPRQSEPVKEGEVR